MTTRTKVILGIVGAAAAGMAIGMLMAPERGTDLRKRVSETAGDWASHLTDLFANAKGELQNLKGRATRTTGNVSDNFS